jgi:serine/threonine-protein kinase
MAATSSSAVPELAGRYAVEADEQGRPRMLGRGGMATVYRAYDRRHGRTVAIKVLGPELAAVLGRERFLAEIRTLAALQHPNILPLFDSGDEAGLLWFAMPCIEGESLGDRLARERLLPVADALRVGREVADALAYAHERGVVHRDVKPGNILLAGYPPARGRGGDWHALVADFGLARAVSVAGGERLTSTGLAVGTPVYMSPEQAAGDAVDERTDVYALGCVLYEMLVGEPPFAGGTLQALLARRLTEPPPSPRARRPEVTVALDHAVTRALEPDPARRFGGAAELRAALGADAAPRRRSRARGYVVLAASVLLAAAVLVALRSRRPAADRVALPATRLAVLPLAPSTEDSGLVRLGRDLAITLATSLDGVGDVRTVDAHTVLAQLPPDRAMLPLAEGTALARRFGAGSVLHGALVRLGDRVRADVGWTAETGRVLARASAVAPADSLEALTDSLARALLRQYWGGGPAPPSPSLEVALATRDVAALRAFLEGERALVAGRWDDAVVAFRRAGEIDSTFWLAKHRYVFASDWVLIERDSGIVASLRANYRGLPERERLMVEATLALDTQASASLAYLERAVERFPANWPARLDLADRLVHFGGPLGRSRPAARAAFEEVVRLHPGLIPGWEHFVLLALQDRDEPAVARAMRALDSLDAAPVLATDGFGDHMLQFRLLDQLQRGDSTGLDARLDSVARDIVAHRSYGGSFYDPIRYGLPAAQIELSRRVLALGPAAPREVAGNSLAIARAWAVRGAWDSALVAADAHAEGRVVAIAGGALDRYRLLVYGAWLGALPPDTAERRRRAALADAADDRELRAEVAWLDGLLAIARRDRAALDRARAALRTTGAETAASLGRSLAGLAEPADGRALAALERELAERVYRGLESHPYLPAVHRLAAARRLAADGELEQAERLLAWVELPYVIHAMTEPSIVATGAVLLERAALAEARGDRPAARRYLDDFLRRHDRPVASQRHLVARARASLHRLRSE